MRQVKMLIVMMAMVFLITGSTRGSVGSRTLLVDTAVTADGDKPTPPRSKHCPPGKDDHHDFNYQDDGQKGGNNQGNDTKDKDKDKDQDKDKDHHDNCGKGDDGKNP
jgi:hypothetical protein